MLIQKDTDNLNSSMSTEGSDFIAKNLPPEFHVQMSSLVNSTKY